MRIGIAQINPTLGDFATNYQKIFENIKVAKDKKCEMLIFPEAALFGYHPFDLLERAELVEMQNKYVQLLEKKIPQGIAVLFGFIRANKSKKGRPYFNSVALIQKGKKAQFFDKQLLPTGDVFDEARFIEPGSVKNNYFTWKGLRFFLTICEDIWAWPDGKKNSAYTKNPLLSVPKKKVDFVINMSASPFYLGKMKLREAMSLQTAKHFKAPVIYVNLVGAQDEIIFDGASFIIDQKGKKLLQCHSFDEDFNVIDTDSREAWSKVESLKETELLHRALVLGIRDFVAKTGLKKIHLGISGGIDSAVVACLAVDALGPQKVSLIAMPGPYSADMSLTLAEKLAKNLNVEFISVPINESYKSTLKSINVAFKISESVSVVHENIQSRLRGLFLMAYSNQANSLLLATGNKSEYATGYSTLYGDMCGGLAPIGDLLKHQVYELAKYYNCEHELIPQQIINRPPTAELRPNQKDQDSLPPYDQLDQAVENIVEKCTSAKKPIQKWLLSKLIHTEFKRWQAPPILKVSAHAFGRGRRYPIAHKSAF
ncbi:MAG: NAD+ synthase [Bdellovibrionota bacterium]